MPSIKPSLHVMRGTHAMAVVAKKLCAAWLTGVVALTSIVPGRAADQAPTPVTERCYIDCAGGCRILRGGTDAAGEEVYAPDRSAWREFTQFMGWSKPPPTVLDVLPDLQRSGRCPAATDPNPSPCRLRFVRTEGFRGIETFYNIEAGEQHRVLGARVAGADILLLARRLREVGQCPNELSRLPAPTAGTISTE